MKMVMKLNLFYIKLPFVKNQKKGRQEKKKNQLKQEAK